MADYWKSQARKYCDFCKCWIADNRPSIDFHEKGRRHQDNVAKKLKYLTKKTKREEKDSLKADTVLRQIESAALEAYRKDVENNADLSGVAINKKLQDANLTETEDTPGKRLWKEAKTRDGVSYYYNVMTNETIWQPPKEGFLNLVEQRKEFDEMTKKQLKIVHKQRQLDARFRMQEQKQEEAEARAAAAREKMKERRVEPEPEIVSGPILPTGKTDPYGQWTRVEISKPMIDLQLPKQECEYFAVPVASEIEPPPREFKERTVECLDGGSGTFKKRKIGHGAKRNTRQRLEDD